MFLKSRLLFFLMNTYMISDPAFVEPWKPYLQRRARIGFSQVALTATQFALFFGEDVSLLCRPQSALTAMQRADRVLYKKLFCNPGEIVELNSGHVTNLGRPHPYACNYNGKKLDQLFSLEEAVHYLESIDQKVQSVLGSDISAKNMHTRPLLKSSRVRPLQSRQS
jgi:hypothetical protein